MKQEIRTTNKNTKNSRRITKGGCKIINSAVIICLVLAECCGPKTKTSDVPNLTYVDTLLLDVKGDPVRREVGMMKDSMKQGLWMLFYPSGKIYGIESFDNGEWNGPWYLFHENGQPFAYRGTKDGGFHGKGYNYYSNGVLMDKVYFIDDKADGIFEHYDEKGNLTEAIECRNGEYVRTVYGSPPIIEY